MIPITNIPGLYQQLDVLTPEQEQEILSWLDSPASVDGPAGWSNTLSRRTQHYGYEYDYKVKAVSPTPTIPFRGPIQTIAEWLSYVKDSDGNPMSVRSDGQPGFEQCIVNEYTRNQGIAAHTDSLSFGPVIVSISLGGLANMIFTKGNESHQLILHPRSLLIMTGESRYQWKHEIPKRVTVTLWDGVIPESTYKKSENYRRVSLTYRTLAQRNN